MIFLWISIKHYICVPFFSSILFTCGIAKFRFIYFCPIYCHRKWIFLICMICCTCFVIHCICSCFSKGWYTFCIRTTPFLSIHKRCLNFIHSTCCCSYIYLFLTSIINRKWFWLWLRYNYICKFCWGNCKIKFVCSCIDSYPFYYYGCCSNIFIIFILNSIISTFC